MLDLGFEKDIRAILSNIKTKHQTLMFRYAEIKRKKYICNPSKKKKKKAQHGPRLSKPSRKNSSTTPSR